LLLYFRLPALSVVEGVEGLPVEYLLAFFKEAIILIAVSLQQSAISQIILMLLAEL
jgi:hypothetical protein